VAKTRDAAGGRSGVKLAELLESLLDLMLGLVRHMNVGIGQTRTVRTTRVLNLVLSLAQELNRSEAAGTLPVPRRMVSTQGRILEREKLHTPCVDIFRPCARPHCTDSDGRVPAGVGLASALPTLW
jgi:hypothetical protein